MLGSLYCCVRTQDILEHGLFGPAEALAERRRCTDRAVVLDQFQGDRQLGRTVTAGFSLSVEPPTFLVSIAEHSDLAQMIRAIGRFSVATLSETQRDVADAFAGKSLPEDRFRSGRWQTWDSGMPILMEAVTSMDCAVVTQMTLHGHVLFAGAVNELTFGNTGRPLVWHHRRYNTVHPFPSGG